MLIISLCNKSIIIGTRRVVLHGFITMIKTPQDPVMILMDIQKELPLLIPFLDFGLFIQFLGGRMVPRFHITILLMKLITGSLFSV